MHEIDKDLLSIQEARVLLETATDAQLLMKGFGQEYLHTLAKVVIKEIEPLISHYVSCEVEETGKGCPKDKEQLIFQFLSKFYSEIGTKTYIGTTKEDSAGKILKVGVPLGVVPVLLPSENSVLNTIYSLLMGIESGNAMIAIPDSKAYTSTFQVVQKIQQICEANGLPRGCISCIEYLTEIGVKEIIKNQSASMIVILGQKKYSDTTVSTRPIIYGGSGATPTFIEHSADVKKAAKSIVESRSFDCGLLPASEQYLIVENQIAIEVKEELQKNGAHFLSKEEEDKLIGLLQPENNQMNEACVGKNAEWLAEQSGFVVLKGTRVLVSEQAYIYDMDPFANEMNCPVIAFYVEPDWMHACEKSICLLKEKNNGHTLAIHSENQQIINEYALKKPVARMIVNASASFSSLGLDSELPLSTILGGYTMGCGISAQNITATDLTYTREISYASCLKKNKEERKQTVKDTQIQTQLLEKVLRKILEK